MPPTPKTGGSKRCFAERESKCFYFQISFWHVLRCCWSLRSLGWYADTDFTRKIFFLKTLHSTDATRPLIFVAHVDISVPFCLWKSVDFCIIYQALHFTLFLWWPWWKWLDSHGPPASPVGTHAKQQNPSRIQAQRVAIWSAEPLPFGHLRTR